MTRGLVVCFTCVTLSLPLRWDDLRVQVNPQELSASSSFLKTGFESSRTAFEGCLCLCVAIRALETPRTLALAPPSQKDAFTPTAKISKEDGM